MKTNQDTIIIPKRLPTIPDICFCGVKLEKPKEYLYHYDDEFLQRIVSPRDPHTYYNTNNIFQCYNCGILFINDYDIMGYYVRIKKFKLYKTNWRRK